jgi:small-conductance mechanosensitive channel
VLTLSFVISNTISMIVDGGVLNFLKLPKGIPAAISMVLRYIVIAFGFILALSVLGVDLSQFNLMAGALGLGIGFGLQTIISNFVSGLILVFERPILPGDIVEVENLIGNVTNIGVRSSKVRTFDGAEVIVPNNNLISNDLINWTLSDSNKRLEIKIGAAYGSDPNIILKLLIEEAVKNEFTVENPPPVAFFDEFGDSSLNFRLLVWVPYDKGLISKSNISVGIYNSFKENNIEIPFPQRDVHIKEAVALKK